MKLRTPSAENPSDGILLVSFFSPFQNALTVIFLPPTKPELDVLHELLRISQPSVVPEDGIHELDRGLMP